MFPNQWVLHPFHGIIMLLCGTNCEFMVYGFVFTMVFVVFISLLTWIFYKHYKFLKYFIHEFLKNFILY